MIRLFFFSSFLFLFLFDCSYAQEDGCPQSKSKKSIDYFKDAQALYQSKRDYEKARQLIQKAIDEDPEYADAYLLSGYLAMKKKDYKTMEEMLTKAIELCETVDPDAYFQLGWLEYDYKKYKDATQHLKKFLAFDKVNEEHAKQAEGMLVKADLYAHPVPFNPKPVPGISTPNPEYLPYISPDNDFVFFTRRFDQPTKGGLFESMSVEKFMFAKRTNGQFDHGEPLDWPFNQQNISNEGGATITLDNKHLYFTVNKNGNFDICVSDWVDGSWDEIRNLGPNVNDPRQWDSQPSVTTDGKTLYFASSRDSLTGVDIYVTHKDASGSWSKAQKLPPPVNTNGNDKTPFIHPDGKTLYFSSDSLPGLGGYDIFMSKMDEHGRWSTPKNMGYPINTPADEVGFFTSTDGKTGYFASDKIQGKGGFDIYYFDLYSEIRPEPMLMQKGIVKTNDENEHVSATIEIKNVVTNKITSIDVDSVSGQYAFVVDFKNDLIVDIKKNGYAFESKYISAKDTQATAVSKRDITLEKIEVGKPYTINDIYFATNSFDINDTIKSVMIEFSDYLKHNPRMHVTLQGHTDNIGSDEDNLILSENRAKTIYNFLVAKGIDKLRLTYKGFGSSKPIAPNTSEEGRARNRRTVFVVVAK